MTMTKDNTRHDLEETYQYHVEEMARLTALDESGAEQDENGDHPDDLMHDYALHIDTRLTYRVWITMGGPSIFIDVEVDAKDGYAMDMTYESHWGGASYVRALRHDDGGLGDWAASQAEMMWEASQ